MHRISNITDGICSRAVALPNGSQLPTSDSLRFELLIKEGGEMIWSWSFVVNLTAVARVVIAIIVAAIAHLVYKTSK
jgi:hypothetical protein